MFNTKIRTLLVTLAGYPMSQADPHGFGVVGNIITGTGLYPVHIADRCVVLCNVCLQAHSLQPRDNFARILDCRIHQCQYLLSKELPCTYLFCSGPSFCLGIVCSTTLHCDPPPVLFMIFSLLFTCWRLSTVSDSADSVDLLALLGNPFSRHCVYSRKSLSAMAPRLLEMSCIYIFIVVNQLIISGMCNFRALLPCVGQRSAIHC